MKIFYFFLASCLLNVHFCQAQIPLKIKAGAARSNLLIDDGHLEGHPVATWYGGIATTLRMGKRFFFQPELLYSQRGTNLRSMAPVGNSQMIRRYGYISMPLLLGLHPFKKMSFLMGAEPGYMIWNREKGIYYSLTYIGVDRRFNVDIDLGLSYQPLPRWTVEVRALVGLVGIYDEWSQTRYSNFKTDQRQGSHYNIQLGLSYDLKTKKQ